MTEPAFAFSMAELAMVVKVERPVKQRATGREKPFSFSNQLALSLWTHISSADLFKDFHRNIYGFGEIFVCSQRFFFCRFVPGFDRNIWHQIMGFLFARKFLLQIVR
jgi:hypothetical protein